jgi:hypothetical protein
MIHTIDNFREKDRNPVAPTVRFLPVLYVNQDDFHIILRE